MTAVRTFAQSSIDSSLLAFRLTSLASLLLASLGLLGPSNVHGRTLNGAPSRVAQEASNEYQQLTPPSSQQEEQNWRDLDSHARELLEKGSYQDALRAAISAVRVAIAIFGRDNPNLAEALNLAGAAYFYNGDYGSSEKYYKQALEVEHNTFRAGRGDNPGLATTLNNLGALYEQLGRYEEARRFLEDALKIGEQYSRQADLADQLNTLGLVCKNLGDYGAAEKFFGRSREIRESGGENEEPRLAIVLDNLGGLYQEQGRWLDSATVRKESLELLEKRLPEGHPDISITRHNLALSYEELHDYAAAEQLLRASIEFCKGTLSGSSLHLIATCDDVAELLAKERKYVEAEATFKRSIQFLERDRTVNRLDVARSLSKLATMYSEQSRYRDAASEQKQAVELWESALPPGHPTLAAARFQLAQIYFALLQPDQAQPLFEESIDSLKDLFERQFAYMSEDERLSFLRSVEPRFPLYLSFCLKFQDQHPELIGSMYNLLLWEKGIVGSSVAALRARLAHQENPEAVTVLNELTGKRTEIAKRRASQNAEKDQKTIAYLEQEANLLERELVKQSRTESENARLRGETWQDVQKSLGPDEAAIEFVRFPCHDGGAWTSKSVYVALVLTTETVAEPALIRLGDASELEGAPLNEYRKRVGLEKDPSVPADPSFYTAFWKPLEKYVGSRKHIYISPDGVLNQVPFAAIYDNQGRFLLDTYSIEVLLSTRDLLRSPQKYLTENAVLIGNPKFDLSEAEQRIAIKILSDEKSKRLRNPVVCANQPAQETGAIAFEASASRAGTGIISKDVQNGPLVELSDTEEGIDLIRVLLVKEGWGVEVYTRECALEEAVKGVQKPRVLHFATHGFFEPDQETESRGSTGDAGFGLEEPMLRSGLYLAGSNRALRHEALPPDLDDGVLTAYEAATLDLTGTEIVTLTACDTGLGQINRGEGVFGLRRALAEAGAESILMSMWEVPQTQTQELMSLFYEGWLKFHMDKNEALRQAQRKEREMLIKRYHKDVPNYWAAWVLVGR